MPDLAPSGDDALVAEIRANIVFEKLLASVLTVAGAAGLAHFLFALAARAAAGLFSLGGAGTALISALIFAAFFFLAGFAAAVAIGMPLFRALERAKVRKVWPFALASLAVSLVVLAAAGSAPSFEAPWRALYLAPGLAAAVLFGRKMRPFWEAAARADEENSQTVIRLH